MRSCIRTWKRTMSPYSRAKVRNAFSGSRRIFSAMPTIGCPFGPGGLRLPLIGMLRAPSTRLSPYVQRRLGSQLALGRPLATDAFHITTIGFQVWRAQNGGARYYGIPDLDKLAVEIAGFKKIGQRFLPL